jgi:purine nucleosidase
MSMTRRKIIIDTDPGEDDAVAILLALASPELEVLGVCAVHGNVPLARTQDNARALVALGGAQHSVPVFAGCSRPILAPAQTAEEVHGVTGLEGWTPGPARAPLQKQHAVDFIIEAVRSHEEKSITICCIGPMTNLALAMVKAPDIIPRLGGVVAMGGAFFAGGNSTAVAEWNMLVDPHAAEVVFTSGVDLVLMPLDVTHKALTTAERLEAFAAVPAPIGPPVAAMLKAYGRYDMKKYGIPGGPLHDPSTIAYLLEPGLYSGKRVHVSVEHRSESTMGMTVMEWWGVSGRAPNCLVMQNIDSDAYYALIVRRLAALAAGLSSEGKKIRA